MTINNLAKIQTPSTNSDSLPETFLLDTYESPYLIRYSKTLQEQGNEIVAAVRCGGKCGQCVAHYWDK